MARHDQIGRHATTVATDGDWTYVQYHSTVVVKFSRTEIVLNTNGWRTNTTKTRMNQTSNQYGLGFQVYQRNFEWFVDYRGGTLPFVDGMTLSRLTPSQVADKILESLAYGGEFR